MFIWLSTHFVICACAFLTESISWWWRAFIFKIRQTFFFNVPETLVYIPEHVIHFHPFPCVCVEKCVLQWHKNDTYLSHCVSGWPKAWFCQSRCWRNLSVAWPESQNAACDFPPAGRGEGCKKRQKHRRKILSHFTELKLRRRFTVCRPQGRVCGKKWRKVCV